MCSAAAFMDSDSGSNSAATEIIETSGTENVCYDRKDSIEINSSADVAQMDLHKLATSTILKLSFPTLSMAFSFYNWYARLNGFSARKSKVRRNKDGEIMQQFFVCHKQGFREERFSEEKSRQREPRSMTRCGCKALCLVCLDEESNRWYVKDFSDAHIHPLVDQRFVGLLPGHRSIDEDEISHMNNLKRAGVKTPQIFGSFAGKYGGYSNISFSKQDMYNLQDRQKKLGGSDVQVAFSYLRDLKSVDSSYYWNHSVDKDGRLDCLFWSDGRSQLDYSIFGDVVAFDATYNRNKYKCPLVVFSGVNNHNQTIIFATALVSEETTETYVWLLEQFLNAMKGKLPISVITDGANAMKAAIKKVFPNVHHRLCCWHLIRNCTTNLKDSAFTSRFRWCMLGDYEVLDFEQRWNDLLEEFDVENEPWVVKMNSTKELWATAYIRGKFFAGFRTTSRCEGLHTQIGKFVSYRNNLAEFLQQYNMGLEYFRFKETEADFASTHGEVVAQTELKSLELSAARMLTREMFVIFRSILKKGLSVNVVGSKKTSTCSIFYVTRYRRDGQQWIVTHSPTTMELKCSCLRMESFGLPCDHIVRVMVHLDMVELPSNLVADRWKKSAKDHLTYPEQRLNSGWDSMTACRYKALTEKCRDMNIICCKSRETFDETIDLITAHYEKERMKMDNQPKNGTNNGAPDVGDPKKIAKGFGVSASCTKKSRRTVRCGLCGVRGHNRQTCSSQVRRCRTNIDEEYDEDLSDNEGSNC